MSGQRRQPHEDRPHCVYVLRDADGADLYVGITSNLPARVKAHQRTQPWADEIDPAQTVATDEMPWEKALAAEEATIRERKPKHNKYRRNGSLYVDLGVRHLIAQERAERAARKASA